MDKDYTDNVCLNCIVRQLVMVNRHLTKINDKDEQKREKTGKMIGFQHCSFTALYATKKYGCSGLKDNSECLKCEFRR